MPVNNWQHRLFLTDVIRPLAEGTGEFDQLRDELVRRIREAPFYSAEDIVLRTLVNDLAEAGDLDQLGRDFDLFTLWCDQGQRVWLETSFTREQFEEHEHRNPIRHRRNEP